jgi:hypothetical protein
VDRPLTGGESRRAPQGALADRPVGKQLDQELYPGQRSNSAAATDSYAELMNRGNAFIDAIGPVKAAFVEHAMPADFDEQLAICSRSLRRPVCDQQRAAQADGWDRGPGRVGEERRESRSRARLDHAREAEG